jgi:predicted alpha/beta superfamily hydrolase
MTILTTALHTQGVPATTATQTHTVVSELVGDEYIVDVHTPTSYTQSSRPYPVLYVLDGDKSSGMAKDIVDWLSFRREIPELVVVAISHGGSMSDWWQKRSRDFTPSTDRGGVWGEWPLAGGGEVFKEFLRDELFPFVEERYRVEDDDRAIAGISFGGLFAMYTLFTAPDMFQRYIAAGPALIWDNEHMWEYERAFAETHDSLQAIVFTTVGDLDETQIIDPWQRFNTTVLSRRYEGLAWKTHDFEGETHVSVWPAALSRGLREVYSN